jgi:hypothetical protein
MEVSGQPHAPAALAPRERVTGTHWIGGWVGPGAVLDVVVREKFPTPARNRTLEPDFLDRSPALYRLNYHGSNSNEI